MATLEPLHLAQRHLDTVLAHLPAVFDGDPDAVHDARIATRRLREVLPLIDGGRIEDVADTIRKAGRQLGRVRELDVMSGLLESMSDRIPPAAALEMHTLRQAVRQRREKARRRMVKKLERLDLPSLRNLNEHGGRTSRLRQAGRAVSLRAPAWVEPIWSHIAERRAEVLAAVQRAPGIYLPRRAHRARVAIKKLRYAVEVAADTGVWNPPRILKDLRKIQSILGDLHDEQVLMDFVSENQSTETAAPVGLTFITELLAAEISRLHAEYARRRRWLFQIADACERVAARSHWHVPTALVAASMFTAPLVLESVRPVRALPGRSVAG
jgi:CHAD domain-containing protein